MAAQSEKRLVVVIEDDDEVRASTRLLLETGGFAVDDFASAESFLSDGSLSQPYCLVLDCQLPGMSGLDLVDLLRLKGVSTPVIMVSANSRDLLARAIRAGVAAVLRKPLSGEALLQWLEMALPGQALLSA